MADGNRERLLHRGNCNAYFSPDGQYLVSAGDDRFRFYRVGGFELVGEILTESGSDLPNRAAWRPDGLRVAVVQHRREILILETGSWRHALRLRPQDLVNSITFSPDGRHLAVGLTLGGIEVWDLSLVARELAGLGLGTALP
jgi:WD40 repeat protein